MLLYHAPSLPLSQIIADVNKFSNNVMAQQVFLSLSAQESKDNLLGKISQKLKGSFNKSRDVVKHWWQRHFGKNKSQTTEPELENGSGLSRSERISAQSLTALLHTAAKHPHADVFAKSLSIAGVDGTAANMAKRGVANASIGQAQLKTGTLRDVVSIAGYATAQSGQRCSVVGIINHPNAPSARAALDALVEVDGGRSLNDALDYAIQYSLSADIIGYIAATLTTVSFVPQAWHTFRTKDVSGISLGMYSVFTVGIALWLVYGLMLSAWLSSLPMSLPCIGKLDIGDETALP
ncbi:MAG: D-alanyl-D-alanine carboxypeptidase [Polaromonas sp.]|nr:D-alanyl-D-alanine carboxypeptidase [Polaromonas sp.]